MPKATAIPAASQILTDERYKNLARLLHELNKHWVPHPSQEKVGEHIFVNGARRVFIECGRKWGKTDFAANLCWRLGNMIRGGQGYYFGAYKTQVREIIWASQRIQGHGPAEYVKAVNNTEMRITFSSDTFVKLDGADEFKVSKGINPDFVILDEFADYSDAFWNAMSPNFASKDAIVIFISSPPWTLESEPGKPVLFVRIADLYKSYMEEAAKKGMKSKYIYVNEPSTNNPHIPAAWFEEERKTLYAIGDGYLWEREYMARRVSGAGKRIIAPFDPKIHVKPHDWIIKEKIEKDRPHLQWVTVVDPGSSTVFGGLVMAINPYTKEVYWLDEVYEKEPLNMTEHNIWPKLEAIENELYPDEDNAEPERFQRVYDEAAKWWQNGVTNEFNVNFMPTEKATNKIEMGLSLLRSIFYYNKGFVSDRCKWLAWELENYKKDDRDKIPDKNDHLIDSSRYGLHAVGYFLRPEERLIQPVLHPRIRERMLRTPEEEAACLEEALSEDPFRKVDDVIEMMDEWPH
jgi:hypothetical protein